VITDAAAGNQRQALALAEQLGLPVRHLILEPRRPWSWLAPRLMLGGRLALPAAQREFFSPPWPGVAIGCGRAAALFTRLLRPLSDGQCYTVQILDPRMDPAHWDLVIAPRHDRVSGAHVVRPLGSLNPIDDAWLADGRASCPSFADLPRPRVGVLLGGPRQGIALDAAYAGELLIRLLEVRGREGGSLLVLASRRTPPAVMEIFRDAPMASIPIQVCSAGPIVCWSRRTRSTCSAKPVPPVVRCRPSSTRRCRQSWRGFIRHCVKPACCSRSTNQHAQNDRHRCARPRRLQAPCAKGSTRPGWAVHDAGRTQRSRLDASSASNCGASGPRMTSVGSSVVTISPTQVLRPSRLAR
jgi:hypothetical protein